MMNKKKHIICLLFIILTLSSFSVGAATREDCIRTIIINSNINRDDANIGILNNYTDGDVMEYENNIDEIALAVENNIIFGYEDGSLRLTQEATRAELACMLFRAKDYYDTPPIAAPVKFNETYNDISEWNKEEIYYCIENGYMMGYGNSFGSDDIVTDEQLHTISFRLRNGLSVKERYSLYEVCGISPIPTSKILYSAYDTELLNISIDLGSNERLVSINTSDNVAELEKYLELQGNLNYELLSDEAYAEMLLASFTVDGYGRKPISTIGENGINFSLQQKISEATEKQIQRESIFVISPNNNKRYAFIGCEKITGVGYEYYCYDSINGDTPNGEIPGVWYKRKVNATFWEYTSASSQYAQLLCSYGEPEVVQ